MKISNIFEFYKYTARMGQDHTDPSKIVAWQDFMRVLTHRFYAARVGALVGELFEELNMNVMDFKLTRSATDENARWAVKHNLELNEHGKFHMEDYRLRYQKCQAYGLDMMFSINPAIGLYLKYKDRSYVSTIEYDKIADAIDSKDGLAIFKASFPDISYKLDFKDVPEEFKTVLDVQVGHT